MLERKYGKPDGYTVIAVHPEGAEVPEWFERVVVLDYDKRRIDVYDRDAPPPQLPPEPPIDDFYFPEPVFDMSIWKHVGIIDCEEDESKWIDIREMAMGFDNDPINLDTLTALAYFWMDIKKEREEKEVIDVLDEDFQFIPNNRQRRKVPVRKMRKAE